jgi:hypothetical protein
MTATKVDVFLTHEDDGWHVTLVMPDGREVVSEEAYADRSDCENAFNVWCKTIGAKHEHRLSLH